MYMYCLVKCVLCEAHTMRTMYTDHLVLWESSLAAVWSGPNWIDVRVVLHVLVQYTLQYTLLVEGCYW